MPAFADRLAAVQDRIEEACRKAGRSPEEVQLVAVSKTFPMEDVEAAREHGLVDFGENRAGELDEKAEALPGALRDGPVRWHFIGHLQRNKAGSVVDHADVFHALDSPRLARRLERVAAEAGRVVPCYVQVNVSGERSKYGFEAADLPAFLDEAAGLEHLRLVGLMTMAPHYDDPQKTRPVFARLRALAERHQGHAEHIPLNKLSMGMTNDFEQAILEGSTCVRIGSALFGERDYS